MCIGLWSCRHKLPQSWWLTTTEVYSLMVLEARSLKSKYRQDHAPSEDSREDIFLASPHPCRSLPSLAFLVAVSLHPLPLSSQEHIPYFL